MPSKAAAEFEFMFEDSTEPIEQETSDGPDFFTKFFADAELGQALGGTEHVTGLEKEIAVIDARTKAVYKSIASTAKAGGPAQTLEKRAKTTIEETRFPLSGAAVIAELENGVVVKTYLRDPE